MVLTNRFIQLSLHLRYTYHINEIRSQKSKEGTTGRKFRDLPSGCVSQ